MALVGTATGLAGALGLTRVMAGMLFGVSPRNPLTFISVAILLGTIALVACYIPARKAGRVAPILALRNQ